MRPSRWPRFLVALAVGSLVLGTAVTVVSAQDGAYQPTPGPASAEPRPLVTQSNPGPAAPADAPIDQGVAQTPAAQPDLAGAPTQVVGPEDEDAPVHPSEAAEVETAVLGQPD